jgi:HSP20 family protein
MRAWGLVRLSGIADNEVCACRTDAPASRHYLGLGGTTDGRRASLTPGKEGEVMAEEAGKNGKNAVAVAEPEPKGFLDQFEQEFAEMRRRMLDLFRRPPARLYGPPLLSEMTWAPRADAYEQDGMLVIKSELPGVKREDINITVQNGVLTISGERKEEREVKEAQYYASERFSGSFRRSFALPDGVDTKSITAEQKEGVLEVRVPLPVETQATTVKVPIKG